MGDRLVYWTEAELLNMISEPYRSGTKTSKLNETRSSYGSPIEQCISPLPAGESPNTAHTKLKRKASGTGRDREKRRETDKAYRRRCKEKKKKTEEDLVVLTEENKTLKRENDHFKKEGGKQQEMVQTKKEEMKLLQNEVCQLKAQIQRQIVVVDVLSKQVANGENYMVLQAENTKLKLERGLLIKKIKDDDYLNLIQLQAENTKLEQEKKALQVIIDALCAKINKDYDLQQTQSILRY